MTLTVSQVASWQPDTIAGAALRLQAMGSEVAGWRDRFGDLMDVELTNAWSGRTANLAAREGDTRRAELSGIAEGLTVAGNALRIAADRITSAQGTLRRARQLATDQQLELDDDGAVRLPTARQPRPGHGPAAVANLESLRDVQVAGQATRLARQALTQAEQADRAAAGAIADAGAIAQGFAGASHRLLLGITGRLTGVPLLLLATSGMLDGLTLHPMPPDGATPLEVARWWLALDPAQQSLQIRARPEAIGNLISLPASARHQANLLFLLTALNTATTELTRLNQQQHHWQLATGRSPDDSPYHDRIAKLQAKVAMLNSVKTQLDAGPDRTLLLLDTTVPGRAAIGIGAVDTSEHVAVVVPGLEQDVTNEMGNIVGNADRLRFAALRNAPFVGVDSGAAAIAWLGYDTPGFATVGSDDSAIQGAEQLRYSLDGLDAARRAAMETDEAARPLHLTVVGHSYGSVTSGLAVTRTPTPVDDIAFVGSPGVGVDRAGDLNIPQGHVFVGEAKGDAVADLAHFGTDPNQPGFGARNLQTDGGIDPITGVKLQPAHGHSQYFDKRSESVRNLAMIMLGHADEVTFGDMSGFGDGFRQGIAGGWPQ